MTDIQIGPTDQEVADDLKERMRQALLPVCKLMDEAAAHGMSIQFNIGTTPPIMRAVINSLAVVSYPAINITSGAVLTALATPRAASVAFLDVFLKS